MEYISLVREPNLDFTLSRNGYVLYFSFRYFRGMTYCTVTTSDENTLCVSRRICHDTFLLPRIHESKYGNYKLVDDNGEYPVYSMFNRSCVMKVYTAEEADEERNG